jgi:hypothetical protein
MILRPSYREFIASTFWAFTNTKRQDLYAYELLDPEPFVRLSGSGSKVLKMQSNLEKMSIKTI